MKSTHDNKIGTHNNEKPKLKSCFPKWLLKNNFILWNI